MKLGNYSRFGLMMVISFIIMYAVMFLNVDQFDHVMFSTMRVYMTILMIAPMAIVMLLFMWRMYKINLANLAILGTSVLVFGTVYAMMRNQTGISDIQYMKGMIPHHSSAILTSQEADLKDPETKQLAREIISAQKREIAQMKELITKLERK